MAIHKDRALDFLALLDAVERGETDAYVAAKSLRPSLKRDGYCLLNVADEFILAFSFRPGRREALPLIKRLANKILDYPKDSTGPLYEEREWKKLVQMRGPAEGVIVNTCTQCATQRMHILMSGFGGLTARYCASCGNVIFMDDHDSRPLPPCSCGGTWARARDDCMNCGSKEYSTEQQPPYQYFATHSWRWRD